MSRFGWLLAVSVVGLLFASPTEPEAEAATAGDSFTFMSATGGEDCEVPIGGAICATNNMNDIGIACVTIGGVTGRKVVRPGKTVYFRIPNDPALIGLCAFAAGKKRDGTVVSEKKFTITL